MSRLAVIVVNFNGGELLSQCLAALERQTRRAARVLVVDNGSQDGSIAACRAMFAWAEYYELGRNTGFAAANNYGVNLADDCEWIALLNPDAFADPHWIEHFYRRAAEYPAFDVFACCMRWATHPEMLDGAGDVYRVDGLAWPRWQGGPMTRIDPQPEEVIMPSAGAAFYRRRAFVEAGGFCERFFCYYEDVDLGLQLQGLGYRCLFLPDVIVDHVGSALSGKGSTFSVYHAHRNFVWTYLRNMPGHLVWVYLPAHLAASLASMAVFIRKGMGGTILRAKWDAFRALPVTLRERRAIQARRRVSPDVMRARMARGNLATSLVKIGLGILRRR